MLLSLSYLELCRSFLNDHAGLSVSFSPLPSSVLFDCYLQLWAVEGTYHWPYEQSFQLISLSANKASDFMRARQQT